MFYSSLSALKITANIDCFLFWDAKITHSIFVLSHGELFTICLVRCKPFNLLLLNIILFYTGILAKKVITSQELLRLPVSVQLKCLQKCRTLIWKWSIRDIHRAIAAWVKMHSLIHNAAVYILCLEMAFVSSRVEKTTLKLRSSENQLM